jgi:hypothetical protein
MLRSSEATPATSSPRPTSTSRQSPRHGLPPLAPRPNTIGGNSSPRKMALSPRSPDDALSPRDGGQQLQQRPQSFPATPGNQQLSHTFTGIQFVASPPSPQQANGGSPRTQPTPPWVQPQYSLTASGVGVAQPGPVSARGGGGPTWPNNNGNGAPNGINKAVAGPGGPGWVFNNLNTGAPQNGAQNNNPGVGNAGLFLTSINPSSNPTPNGLSPRSPRPGVVALHSLPASTASPSGRPQFAEQTSAQSKVTEWLSANIQHHKQATSPGAAPMPTLSFV